MKESRVGEGRNKEEDRQEVEAQMEREAGHQRGGGRRGGEGQRKGGEAARKQRCKEEGAVSGGTGRGRWKRGKGGKKE